MKQIKVFVLDEADVMIDTQGFKEMSIKLHKSLPTTCQVLLFSATYDDAVMDFAKRVVQKPNVIKLRRDEETLDNIKQYYVECKSPEMKYQALVSISSVLSVGQGIIFCRTKKDGQVASRRNVKRQICCFHAYRRLRCCRQS